MSGANLQVEYRIHQHRFETFNRYYDIVREAMNYLGHTETKKAADINFFNHIAINEPDAIVLKPTAPTSKHFALDRYGYANSSELAFKEPVLNEDIEQMDWASIIEMRANKCNKWDDSILLKWETGKNIPDDHILLICQMPDDETVKGFGFGRHFEKVNDIAIKLNSLKENFIIKMHPRWKARTPYENDLLKSWKDKNIDVRMGYESIHDYLKKARIVIVDNSTSGIEALMHEVPVISYGWPEYHWATEKLQTLTHLERLVKDTTWHRGMYAKMFTEWYINHYLCRDINTTVKRLKALL